MFSINEDNVLGFQMGMHKYYSISNIGYSLNMSKDDFNKIVDSYVNKIIVLHGLVVYQIKDNLKEQCIDYLNSLFMVEKLLYKNTPRD